MQTRYAENYFFSQNNFKPNAFINATPFPELYKECKVQAKQTFLSRFHRFAFFLTKKQERGNYACLQNGKDFLCGARSSSKRDVATHGARFHVAFTQSFYANVRLEKIHRSTKQNVLFSSQFISKFRRSGISARAALLCVGGESICGPHAAEIQSEPEAAGAVRISRQRTW